MILAIDFDDVIHWRANPKPGRKMGPPMEGAQEALTELMLQGHTIIIHSCNRPSVIADWTAFYGIPYSTITNIKPIADWYIDDKALRFVSWEQTMRDIQ